VSKLVQRVYVIDLLFFNQYAMLVKGLHIESYSCEKKETFMAYWRDILYLSNSFVS
jgi:hypothetical protein